MRQTFEILTALHFRHAFFHRDICTALKISIPAYTAALLRRHGLLLKPIVDGCLLLCERRTGQKRSRDALSDDGLLLRLNLELGDPLFFNYTAGNYTCINDHVFYFTNDDTYTAGSLHPDEVVNANDLLPVSIFPHPFFVKPFGTIVLQIKPDLLPVYNIRFGAKELYWRYFLMGNELRQLTGPDIVDTQGHITFSGPAEIQLPDQRIVKTFTSGQPISLRQYLEHQFQLIDRMDNGRQKVVIPLLPGAAADSISAASPITDDITEYKEIFIY